MQRVTLQFTNVQQLWAFARFLEDRNFKADSKKLQLNCTCNEDLISEALTFYKARLITCKVER